MPKSPVRFAAIGLNHYHIHGMTDALKAAGATLVSVYEPEDELAAPYMAKHPEAKRVDDKRTILEDKNLQVVASAAISDERAALGIEVMRHGKDFFVDKPGMITLDQLAEVRKVQKETGRKYIICFSERLEQRATVKAGELVKAGAIGRVIQTIGLGPHQHRPHLRKPWFYQRARYGGILCDIASHQMDQFLFFTGSARAEVVASQIANRNHPQHPELEDFGDVLLRAPGASGYVRVDWFTPDGLGTWGDGRLTLLGTEGYIELRKYIDITGRPGANHLFLVDGKGARYINCENVALPFGPQFVADIVDRTETAMSQEHCFHACELALTAQAKATRLS
ncbi:MAG: Gfo/Idh/MocA family oxidoreductase [Alphaproteobacteria bacterium]|nr:Gfo/Idh/MocA family oxidoreductase [Alphaproteobacteria bacterium]